MRYFGKSSGFDSWKDDNNHYMGLAGLNRTSCGRGGGDKIELTGELVG